MANELMLMGCGASGSGGTPAYSIPIVGSEYGDPEIIFSAPRGVLYSDGVVVAGHGDYVRTWVPTTTDTPGRTIARAADANRAVLRAYGANGNPALAFNGTSTRYDTVPLDTLKSQGTASFYLIFVPTSLTGTQFLYQALTSLTGTRLGIQQNADGSMSFLTRRAAADTLTTNTTATGLILVGVVNLVIGTLNYGTNQLNVWVNGTQRVTNGGISSSGSGTVEALDASAASLGGTTAGASFFSGRIAELGFLDDILTAQKIIDLKTSFDTQYALLPPTSYGTVIAQGDADGELYNDALGVAVNTNTIEEWRDRYGSQTWWRFSNATTAQQPTFNTNQVNGRAALTFDGTDDRLVMPTNDLWKNLTGGSMFFVVKPTLGSARTVFHATMSDGSDRVKVTLNADGSVSIVTKRVTGDTAITNSTGAGKIVAGTWYILSLYFDYTNNNMDLFINGQYEIAGFIGAAGGTLENANSSVGPRLGATAAGANFYSGQMAYWSFFSDVLTDANAGKYLGVVGNYYNINIL